MEMLGCTYAYTMRQENDHYVYHNIATVAIPNECLTSVTPENAHPTMKGARRCANHSHVWTVCRTVYTRQCFEHFRDEFMFYVEA